MLRRERLEKRRSVRRRKRVRRKVIGTSERPRLCVYKSLRHTYAQLVDDRACRTLSAVSSLSPEIRSQIPEEEKKASISRKVGLLLAKKAKELGITKVAFDRNKYPYHGRVKSLAEGAREGGLTF
ncbi:MAG: 50S ribosomal protein L18 [candidate division Zixibacteria bacterium SM1_73]|nr:MAG: 50S ribosomal protein L18 [candidate division Zixibacteria bacterium SM1_73]